MTDVPEPGTTRGTGQASNEQITGERWPPKPVRSVMRASRFVGWPREYATLGCGELYLHHAGVEQRALVETFGKHVLPACARS